MHSRPLILFVALTLGTMLLIAASAYVVGSIQFHSVDQENSARLLETADAVQKYMQEQRARHLQEVSQSIATNTSFVGYIAQALAAKSISGEAVDVASIRDLLDERRKDAGLNAAAIFLPDGRMVAAAGENYFNDRDASVKAAITKAIKELTQVSVVLGQDRRVPLITVTPLARAANVEGVLLTGLTLDEATLKSFASTSQADVAIVAMPAAGPQLVASTLDSHELTALTAFVAKELDQVHRSNSTGVFSFGLGTRSANALISPLAYSDNKALLLSIVPRGNAEATARALAIPLLVAVVAGMALLLIFMAVFWLRMMRPLLTLDGLFARASRGDHALEAKPQGWGIVSRIANGFNYLQSELDRFRIAPGTPRRRTTDR